MERQTTSSPRGPVPPHLPLATLSVLFITAIITGLQFVYPGLLQALRRDPGALLAGEWWRVVTPLFVHDEGWSQIIFNGISLAIIGPTVEECFGSRGWLVLYFVVGLVGEAAGYAWQPSGAGNSIACAGLSGALFVALIRQNSPGRPIATFYALYFVASLIGAAVGSVITTVVLCWVLAGVLVWLLRRGMHPHQMASFIGAGGLLGAVMLTGLRDIHGPPVIEKSYKDWTYDRATVLFKEGTAELP